MIGIKGCLHVVVRIGITGNSTCFLQDWY